MKERQAIGSRKKKRREKERREKDREQGRTREVFFHLFDCENLYRNKDTGKREGVKRKEKERKIQTWSLPNLHLQQAPAPGEPEGREKTRTQEEGRTNTDSGELKTRPLAD